MEEPRRPSLEALLPAALLIWRLAAVAPARLWFDAVALVSAWWIFTAFAGKSRAWAPVTLAFSMGLLLAYALRQGPLILETLRFAL